MVTSDTRQLSAPTIFQATWARLKDGPVEYLSLARGSSLNLVPYTRLATHVLQVGDDDRLQTVGHHVLGLLVGTVSNLGHRGLTREPSSDSVINTCSSRVVSNRTIP